MSDQRRNAMVVLAALAAGAMCAAETSAGDLDVTMAFESKSMGHSVTVTNKSPQFLCVAGEVFDTKRGHVTLTSMNGQPVRRLSYADGPPELYRGVNLAPGYLLLPPGEQRKIYVDMSNFATEEGSYRYQLTFPYYVCKDIIDDRAAVKNQNVPILVVDTQGVITVPARRPIKP